MKLQAPQIIWIALIIINLLIVANKHGQEKTEKQNFWITLINVFINIGLLAWGGFFG